MSTIQADSHRNVAARALREHTKTGTNIIAMMVMIAINMTIIKMMMMKKKKKAWPFMPISDQSERFRARRPETSQRPSAFFIGRRRRMRRMARMMTLMIMVRRRMIVMMLMMMVRGRLMMRNSEVRFHMMKHKYQTNNKCHHYGIKDDEKLPISKNCTKK